MENFNIIEEKKNSLFKRKEIKFTIGAEITPSHTEVRRIISEKFSTPEENIRIKKILGKFGSNDFTISVNIYDSEQDKLDTEGPSKKDAVAQPETPAEQPVEAPTEAPTQKDPVVEPVTETLVEQPVEEKPAEESKEEKTE